MGDSTETENCNQEECQLEGNNNFYVRSYSGFDYLNENVHKLFSDSYNILFQTSSFSATREIQKSFTEPGMNIRTVSEAWKVNFSGLVWIKFIT